MAKTEDMERARCPDCGSTKLEFPQDIEIREGVFIKGKDVQLRKISNEAIVLICKECGGKIKARELLGI